MCRSARDTLLDTALNTSPLWWEPLILHTKQRKHSTNHTSERLQDTSIPWAPGGGQGQDPQEPGALRGTLKRTLNFLLSTSAVGCLIPFRGLLITASADVLMLIPYEVQQGGLCLSPRKNNAYFCHCCHAKVHPSPDPTPYGPFL